MNAIRRAISVLVISVLCIWLGLGSTAHALSTGCIGGECGGDADLAVENLHFGHATVMMAKDVPQDPDSAPTDGCGPLLCKVFLLNTQRLVAKFDQTDIVLVWQLRQLSALEEPETPDRPPNL